MNVRYFRPAFRMTLPRTGVLHLLERTPRCKPSLSVHAGTNFVHSDANWRTRRRCLSGLERPERLPHLARSRFSAIDRRSLAHNRLCAQHRAGSLPATLVSWRKTGFAPSTMPVLSRILAQNRLRAQHAAGSQPATPVSWRKTGAVPNTLPVLCQEAAEHGANPPSHGCA